MEKQIITIHSENIPATAITKIAKDLFNYFSALPEYDVVMDYKFDNLKGTVINLLPHDIDRIHNMKRFTGIKNIVNLFCPNLQEYPKEKLVTYFMYILKYPTVAYSYTSYDDLLDFAFATFSNEIYQQIRKNITVIPYGIPDIFKSDGSNDKNKFIVPTNRVNEGQKQSKLHLELSKKVKALLPETEHTFMFSPKFFKDESGKITEFYKCKEAIVNVDDYVNELKQYGFFISTSKTESFGLYYLELLASGVIGVYLDYPWVTTVLPPDYPYIYTKAELPEALQALYADYPKAKKYIDTIITPLVKEKYSVNRFCSEFNNLIKNNGKATN